MVQMGPSTTSVLFVLLALLSGARQQEDLDAKIKNLFDGVDAPLDNTTASPGSPENCECVAYYLCTNDSRIDTTGAGVLNLREDECGHYTLWCCIPSPTPRLPQLNISRGCGQRHPEGVGFRITGDTDNEAHFGEFPWMVAVLHVRANSIGGKTSESYVCGGALIHPQAVLTSAHCVLDKRKKFLVRAGEWDTQTTTEIFPHQDRHVKSVVTHPDYYSGGFFNDIAILVLESPFNLTGHIDVVCLPPQGTKIPEGTRCFASGWGKNVFGKDGEYQVILKKVELPLVGREVCQENLRKTRLGPRFELDESFVCAGGEAGIDTCKGDGGSPLVCPIPGEEDRYQHVGIVSWGIGCGEHQVPGMYADVALFRDWIDEQLSRHNLFLTGS